MSEQASYDAFLSYNNADNAVVELFARQLDAKGLRIFWDRWYLVPGSPWVDHLEEILSQCKSVVVFLGNSGMGSWQQREQNLALDRQAHNKDFRVIPILLPGADAPLGFLSLNTWLDFRNGVNNQSLFELLVLAVNGQPMGSALLRQTTDTLENICPYRGLQYFREEDAAFFFGRNDFTTKLQRVVRDKPIVSVIGPSGCGKSSIVRAGLIPFLRKGAGDTVWDFGTMVPGNFPLQSISVLLINWLEQAMTETDRLIEIAKLTASLKEGQLKLKDILARCLQKQPGTNRIMLVVDQWEELYTLADRPSADLFISELLDAVSLDFFSVVFTIRTDFFDRVLASRRLADQLADATVLVSPMSRQELTEAIELPAQKTRLQFEPGLIKRILSDVLDGPGNLPLLEFVLTELWKQREAGMLSHRAYEAIGELKGSLAQHAEARFSKLSPAEQDAARRIFLRLITVNAYATDNEKLNKITRRRISFPAAENDAVVQKLANAHLIVTGRNDATGEEDIELVHEALIGSWNSFQQWIKNDQEFLVWREQLRLVMSLGSSKTFSEKAYLQGTSLAEANKWLQLRSPDFEPSERNFIGTSNTRKKRTAWQVVSALVAIILVIVVIVWPRHRVGPVTGKETQNKADTMKLAGIASHRTIGNNFTTFSIRQLAEAYSFPDTLDGSGQTIGIIELGGGYSNADMVSYFADLAIPVPNIKSVSVGGMHNKPGSFSDDEVTAGIQTAGAAAPGAKLAVYFGPNTSEGFIQTVNAAVTDQDNRPSVIFIGWGAAENAFTTSAMASMDSVFQLAASRHITIIASVGDSGPDDAVKDGKPHVDFPGSSPYVLACGGTKLIASSTGELISEDVWNASQDSKTGGGASSFFPVPEWQQKVNTGGWKGRMVPDVSANADPSGGFTVFVHGKKVVLGGSTIALPLWAGLIARINQGIGKNIGYINPLLYTKLGPDGMLYDIVKGNNKTDSLGSSAGPGWDACTGWGSPNGQKLLDALKPLIK